MPTVEELEAQLAETKAKFEEQQAHIKKLNDEAAKARIANRELKEKTSAFENIDPERYKALEKEAEKREREKLEAQGKYEELLARQKENQAKIEAEFKAQIEAASQNAAKAQQMYEKEVIDRQILAAAASANAIDPDEVAMLVRSNVKLNPETGKPEVLSSDGGVMRDDKGDPMTIAGFVKSWLDDRPHHVKGQGGGSGSRGGAYDAQGNVPDNPTAKILAGLK